MLPAGFRIALDPGVRRQDGGRVLIGGAPLRILRLSPEGARVVDALAGGEPVGTGPARRRLARRLLDAGMAHPRPPEGMVDPGAVTVVIPVRDRADGLALTLAALGDGEVIVVDDGSRSPVRGTVTVLRHPRSRGPGAARNTGWGAAHTPLVAFVDADCEPDPGWLAALLPHFADPAVGAVAPRVVARPAPGAPGWLAAYEQTESPLDAGTREAAVRPRSPVPYVPSAVLVVRRSALEAVGGFDEALRTGEDVDLVWRLGQAGWTVRFEPGATATHPTRPTLGAWVRQRVEYGSSAAPLARRHGAAVAPAAVSGWSALAWGLAGVGWPGRGTAVAAGTTALLAPRLRRLPHPARLAARLAGVGHLRAGAQLATAVRRAWWPVLVPVALARRRARPAVMAAFVLPVMARWWSVRPAMGPAPFCALRLADDVAYSVGVWRGCIRERSLAALRPDLTNWPGRQPAVVSPTMDTNDTISPG